MDPFLRLELNGQVNSAAGLELAGKATTTHLDQITGCELLLAIMGDAVSAKMIRRYVPSAAPERAAPLPEDPMRMQAWLGRVILVPAHPTQAPFFKAASKRESKAADKQRRKAVKGTQTLDLCHCGLRGHARRIRKRKTLQRLAAATGLRGAVPQLRIR